jgi:tetratricopeptide (TPR) repeat protein
MAKDKEGAAREYRAALTMDTCNGYAWLGVGEAANALDRPDLAIRSLRVATRLLPRHHGALLLLAKAYEAFGQRPLAAEAYRRALELSPGLPDAVEGYARTR